MTDPVQPKTRKKPGPKPVKGDLAVLALKRLYEKEPMMQRDVIRSAVGNCSNARQLRELADAIEGIDDPDGYRDAHAWFDLIDKRTNGPAAKE